MLHPGCRTPWNLGNTGMNCIWTGSADCKSQGCRNGSQVWRSRHLYLEDVAEMDDTTWELCQCWISTGFGLGRELSHSATCILNYSDCKVCPSFIVLLLALRRMRNKWVAVILRYQMIDPISRFISLWVWRSIKLLKILNESVPGHTHTYTSDSSM